MDRQKKLLLFGAAWVSALLLTASTIGAVIIALHEKEPVND